MGERIDRTMSRWRDIVRDEVRKRVGQRDDDMFTRQGLLEQALPRLEQEFPNAETPGQTMSKALQELRDRGEIEFVQPGVYRLLATTQEQSRELDELFEHPGKRPDAVEVRETEITERPFQSWFRSRVLPNFDHACAICKITPEWFLDAAHLRPVADHPDLAGDPAAGIALCKNHHVTLDMGALVVEADRRVRVVKEKLQPTSDEARRQVLAYDGVVVEPARYDLTEDALPSAGHRS